MDISHHSEYLTVDVGKTRQWFVSADYLTCVRCFYRCWYALESDKMMINLLLVITNFRVQLIFFLYVSLFFYRFDI